VDWPLCLTLCLFGLGFLGILSSVWALTVTRVPVLRTPAALLSGIRAALDPGAGQVVVDAGCADGRTLLALCEREDVTGRGFELNGPVWLLARMKVLFAGRSARVHIRWGDFFRGDLEDVDLVYCYLMPGLMPEVAAKCLEEMRPGSRLASFQWQVPGWQAEQVVPLGALGDPLYIYRLPPSSTDPDPVPESQENSP
jgi:SAM-dependent methyltransferase